MAVVTEKNHEKLLGSCRCMLMAVSPDHRERMRRETVAASADWGRAFSARTTLRILRRNTLGNNGKSEEICENTGYLSE